MHGTRRKRPQIRTQARITSAIRPTFFSRRRRRGTGNIGVTCSSSSRSSWPRGGSKANRANRSPWLIRQAKGQLSRGRAAIADILYERIAYISWHDPWCPWLQRLAAYRTSNTHRIRLPVSFPHCRCILQVRRARLRRPGGKTQRSVCVEP